jgi:hypothetical protein
MMRMLELGLGLTDRKEEEGDKEAGQTARAAR